MALNLDEKMAIVASVNETASKAISLVVAELDGLIDAYGALYGFEELAKLLYVFRASEHGGLGYRIERASFWLEAWQVDHGRKLILIDGEGLSRKKTNREAAAALRAAIAREFEGKRGFWDHVWRGAKGTALAGLGLCETLAGVAGVCAPEPTGATKAAGYVLLGFGAATTMEGVTLALGGNGGEGYNPIRMAFVALAKELRSSNPESVGSQVYALTHLLAGLGATYTLIQIPGRQFIHRGTYTGQGFANYYKEGWTMGRLQLNYPMASDGRVLINITNNSNQWVLRFQTRQGRLEMNGRIIGVDAQPHITNPLEMLKILVKLALRWPPLK